MSDIQSITYPCSIDCSLQPAMIFLASGDQPRPLLVALHTWSFGFDYGYDDYLSVCRKKNWHLIFPHFRGPNWNPQGCGSEFVVSDLEDAVHYMKSTVKVDSQRVYLIGGSGGGHCSLLLAGRHPELWTAVSSWCPISDLAAWYNQCLDRPCRGYSEHIAKACGGSPNDDDKAAEEAQNRSPLTWLHNASDIPVDISTGIHDGHTGSVPVSQAIRAFNVLARPEDRMSSDDCEFITRNQAFPADFPSPEEDESFGSHKVLFRRQSGNARLTIFEGGHDILAATGIAWLEQQVRGQNPDWSIPRLSPLEATASQLSK